MTRNQVEELQEKKMAYGGNHVLVVCLKKGMLPTYVVCRNNPSRVQYLLLRFLDYIHPVGLNVWSARNRDRCLHNTQQKHIHALNRIQTRDPSNQAASDRTNTGIVPLLIYHLLFYDVQHPQRRIKRISLPRVEQIVSCSETSVTCRCFQRGIVEYYKHPHNSWRAV
jgi:hypothetical protein